MKTGDNGLCLCLFAFVLSISACTHPEQDGCMVALKYNKCQDDFVAKLRNDRDAFVNGFDYRQYDNREAAENELREILSENISLYEHQIMSANKVYDEYRRRYTKNARKKFQFNNSYLLAINDVDFNPERVICQIMESDKVLACMRHLMPLRPKIAQMCRDLKGRELVERGDSRYFNDDWKLVIGEECVDKLIVTDSSKNNDKWKYYVKMRVRDGGHYFNAVAEIVYTASGLDKEWTLTDVISQNLSIYKTHIYRSSIPPPKIEVVKDYWGDPINKDVTISSTCDSPLIVGGEMWVDDDIGWKKFVLTLSSLGSFTIHCGYRVDPLPVIRLDFVEKK
ncbi:MAG: hypothetical protein IJU81_01310 [Bacteroidales bacterium]|nr:hypothetical protein [Bacteroidales bacterium]